MNQIAVELDKLQKVCRHTKDNIVDGDTLELYTDELADLPPAQVVQAIRELRKTVTFFPSLAEIRNRVVAIIGEAVLVDPEAAFGEVMRQVRRVGIKGKLTTFHNGESIVIAEREFTSPLIEKAVEAIGWESFCTVEDENMGTLRAQFRDALRVTQAREIDRVVSGRATDNASLTALQRGGVKALPDKGAA